MISFKEFISLKEDLKRDVSDNLYIKGLYGIENLLLKLSLDGTAEKFVDKDVVKISDKVDKEYIKQLRSKPKNLHAFGMLSVGTEENDKEVQLKYSIDYPFEIEEGKNYNTSSSVFRKLLSEQFSLSENFLKSSTITLEIKTIKRQKKKDFYLQIIIKSPRDKAVEALQKMAISLTKKH